MNKVDAVVLSAMGALVGVGILLHVWGRMERELTQLAIP